jgi:aryl-alcohol dehydrogenase-like predicted oxidoreductase
LKRDSLLASAKKSLEELKVDQVNIFFLHSPDPDTPIEEFLETIQELYKQGTFKQVSQKFLSIPSKWTED